jgi:hypothetical protein
LVIAEDKNLQKCLIIVEDIAIDPILDFNPYGGAISKIITKSYPKLTMESLVIGEQGKQL